MIGNCAIQQAARFVLKKTYRAIGDAFNISPRTAWHHCQTPNKIRAWEDRPEAEKVGAIEEAKKIFGEKVIFDFCPNCSSEVLENGQQLQTSTFDGYCCAVCGWLEFNINSEWTRREVEVEFMSAEECDCGNKIRHNNGGNYHSTWWAVI